MAKRGRPPPPAKPKVDLEALLARLEEAESTLSAIREGHVEALVVSSEHGPRVYALEGSDSRYRRLVETMSEGALLVGGSGLVLYSNEAFANMVDVHLERVIGRPLADFVAHRQEHSLAALIEGAQTRPTAGETWLRGP